MAPAARLPPKPSAEDLGLALPTHFGSDFRRLRSKPAISRYISTSHTALPFVLRSPGTLRFGQFHFHVSNALDIGNADIHFHRKVRGVLPDIPWKPGSSGANLRDR